MIVILDSTISISRQYGLITSIVFLSVPDCLGYTPSLCTQQRNKRGHSSNIINWHLGQKTLPILQSQAWRDWLRCDKGLGWGGVGNSLLNVSPSREYNCKGPIQPPAPSIPINPLTSCALGSVARWKVLSTDPANVL